MGSWPLRQLGKGACTITVLCVGLAACPPPAPPPNTPAAPNLSADEPQRCGAGQDETAGNCTPEGCSSPPEPEEGSGGSNAQEEIDCAKWDD